MKELLYEVTTSQTIVESAQKWCEQQFGERLSPKYTEGKWIVFWSGMFSPVEYTWYFKNEKDAMLFSLRWL